MPTPTAAFADAAAKYGDVDPEDIEAVQKWFAEELPTLSPDTIERIFDDLLARDGDSESREIVPVYPDPDECGIGFCSYLPSTAPFTVAFRPNER